jgi:Amt family ammonium transporter
MARLNLPHNSDSAEQQEILDALPVLVFLERAGEIVFANAEARLLLGCADGEWTPCPVEDVLWGLSPGMAEPQTLLTGGSEGSPFHATVHTAHGQMLPVEGTCRILKADPREAVIVAHTLGQVQMPRLRLMDDVLSSVPEALVIVYSRRVLYTNPAFTRMFGYTADEAGEGDLWELMVPESRRDEDGLLEMAVDRDGLARIETVRTNKSGQRLDVAILAGPLLVDGAKAGYVLSFRDIGEREQKEAGFEHDALTGLHEVSGVLLHDA